MVEKETLPQLLPTGLDRNSDHSTLLGQAQALVPARVDVRVDVGFGKWGRSW
jgi:hypothetical protein